MANTFHQVYIQAIFAVKYRGAVINKSWKPQLLTRIGNLILETGCKNIIVNGVEDHVHCFIGLKPTVSISELMKIVKSKSSKFVNDNLLTQQRFEWQEGYAAFSYSQSQIDSVFKYVQNQEEHHKNQTFKDEYVGLLNRFEIPFEEQYIFADLI